MAPTMKEEDLYKELARIFRPHTTERRKNFFEQGKRFVHYTSAENAMRIIQSKTVWLRNARCMNDYMEVYHGYEQLEKFFSGTRQEKGFF